MLKQLWRLLSVIVVVVPCVMTASNLTWGGASTSDDTEIKSSVVKISVHSNPPDLLSPWQKSGMQSAAGSGVIIDGRRILTNAHVVEDAVSIEVKRAGGSETYSAKATYVGHDCDLALLTVDDGRFFENSKSLPVADMPNLQAAVQVYGFPVGGETISVTSGIMSRVEVSTYLHSMEDLLLAQIDASINSGNSGGPVVADGSIVGIAMQSLEEAENVGYMIPSPVIAHFLKDVEDGTYDGFPRLGAEFQDLESPANRASLDMKASQSGALVCRIDHGSPADSVLRTDDVLLSIDGYPVANDATVSRPSLGRVYLSEVFQSKQVGETLSMTVLRDGQEVALELELTPHQFLVPYRRVNIEPDYLVLGGLVFQPLTYEYLMNFEELPADLANLAFYQNVATIDRSQVILIQKVLPHSVNRGYQDWEDYIVESINGTTPSDMAHLGRILDAAEGPWIEILTADGSRLTLSRGEARAAQKAILSGFGIAEDRSTRLTELTRVAQAQ